MFSLSPNLINNADASSLVFYGSNFDFYIPLAHEIGFQDSPSTMFFVYINVTTGNLNSSVNVIGLYDNQYGYFTLTSLENCDIHMYSTGETAIFKKNGVVFSGDTAISISETITLSWNFPIYHTVTLRNGVHGTSNPLGTFTESEGTIILITATPGSADYLFSYWQVLHSNRLGQNPYNLVVTRDMDITPYFKHVPGTASWDLLTYIFPVVIMLALVGFSIVIIKVKGK